MADRKRRGVRGGALELPIERANPERLPGPQLPAAPHRQDRGGRWLCIWNDARPRADRLRID